MHNNDQVKHDFNFRLPFATKCGWPARLLGVLQRTAYPYVVAVWNPAFNAEEMHTYDADGKQPVDGNYDHDKGVKDGPLSLVNIDDDTYFKVEAGDLVHAHVYPLTPFPPNCNPFRFDASNMGTDLVRSWIVMHEGFGQPDFPTPLRYFYLVNTKSGQRIGIRLTPMHQIEVEHRTSTGELMWRDQG